VKDPGDNFYPCFRQAAQAEGLAIREPWTRKPTAWIPNPDLELYGYREFKKLWALPEKPDGVIVWPDTVGRGVITAILDTGRPIVSQQMKFVLHRNSRARLLCPFPATWAISSEDLMAAELIGIIQKQFSGEKISPVLLPYSFESDEGIE
jgi:DNA-binding LacI/PurR family transcriptional regulator